jgi:hypothetical protein
MMTRTMIPGITMVAPVGIASDVAVINPPSFLGRWS